MKSKLLHLVFLAFTALSFGACSSDTTSNLEAANAVHLYQESVSMLEPIFQNADRVETAVLGLDTTAAKTHLESIETSTDEALKFWESITGDVKGSEAFIEVCKNWANFYNDAQSNYEAVFPIIRTDTMTTADQQAIRIIFNGIYQQDSLLRVEFIAERDALFKRYNIMLSDSTNAPK